MTPHLTPHLTEDQLDEYLIGLASPQAHSHAVAHLAQCSTCAARKTEFTEAIATFNQTTLAWSVAKSNTLTRDLTPTPSALSPRLAFAAASLCAVAMLGTLLTGHLLTSADPTPSAQSAQTAPIDREREIARDNAMLQDIDAALYRPDPSPEQVYRLNNPANQPQPPSEIRE